MGGRVLFQIRNHLAPRLRGRLNQCRKEGFTFGEHLAISTESFQTEVTDFSVKSGGSDWTSIRNTSHASFGFSIWMQRTPSSLISFTVDESDALCENWNEYVRKHRMDIKTSMWRRDGLGRKGMVQLPSNDSLFLLQKPAKERSPFLLVSLDNGLVSGSTLLVLVVTVIISPHQAYLTPRAYLNNWTTIWSSHESESSNSIMLSLASLQMKMVVEWKNKALSLSRRFESELSLLLSSEREG